MGELTFYFDRCFGKRFPQALEAIKPPFKVEYQHSRKSKFKQDMKDDDWLKMCGTMKWIAFSHDRKFHKIDVEAMAIKQHSVAAFSLCGASDPSWEKLCHFVRAYPKIAEIMKTEQPPYLYRIHPTGRVEKVQLP